MKKFITQGIILSRTEFGEADRIITFLTPDHGKVRAIAKGVRKSRSKLAGGIELFSVSDLSFIVGRSEINTLISTRLVKHYGSIVKDIDRTNLAYELIKILDKVTEDHPESAYFNLLQRAFEALDDKQIEPGLAALWFNMQLLKIAGHTPDLYTDISNNKLSRDKTYNFEFGAMKFEPASKKQGNFNSYHIQFLRMGFDNHPPKVLQRIQNSDEFVRLCQPLVLNITRNFIRP